jgi:hypothetical protein
MKNWWIFHSHVSSFTRGYPSVTYSYPWVNPISYPIVTPCAKGLNVQWLTEPGLSSCWSQASRPKLGEICSLYLYKIQITNHGFKRKRIHKWLNFHNNLQISTVSNYYQWLHNHNQLYLLDLYLVIIPHTFVAVTTGTHLISTRCLDLRVSSSPVSVSLRSQWF